MSGHLNYKLIVKYCDIIQGKRRFFCFVLFCLSSHSRFQHLWCFKIFSVQQISLLTCIKTAGEKSQNCNAQPCFLPQLDLQFHPESRGMILGLTFSNPISKPVSCPWSLHHNPAPESQQVVHSASTAQT